MLLDTYVKLQNDLLKGSLLKDNSRQWNFGTLDNFNFLMLPNITYIVFTIHSNMYYVDNAKVFVNSNAIENWDKILNADYIKHRGSGIEYRIDCIRENHKTLKQAAILSTTEGYGDIVINYEMIKKYITIGGTKYSDLRFVVPYDKINQNEPYRGLIYIYNDIGNVYGVILPVV